MREAPARAEILWRPYTQHALAEPPLFIERAEGAWLHARGGRRIFDAISSWWVTLHGHAQPRIAEAVARQAKVLEQVIFAGFTHAPAEGLAERLVAVAPRGLTRVFLSNDGSTAVEAALKMAVGFWANRGERRPLFAALEHAYHGDTFGAMSASARGAFTAPYADLLFPVERLPFPEPGREEATLEAFDRLIGARGGELAGLILEPLVLGAGGMRIYSANLLRELRLRCLKAGVLFIADEVMTGFGRTGALFACELAGITPDLLCLSKGITGGFLPLGATLATEELFQSFSEEPVFERIAAIARLHERELKRFEGRAEVSKTRRLGTIAAVELRAGDPGYLSEVGPAVHRYALDRGVLLRPLGQVVYLLPPYCSTESELCRAYEVLEESLLLI